MKTKHVMGAGLVLVLVILNLGLLSFVQWRRAVALERELTMVKTAQQRVTEQEIGIPADVSRLSFVEQMHRAIGKGDLNALRSLLDAHPELVNANTHNAFGSTPLHFAAYNKQPEVAEELIKRGADLNALNNDGMTPLHDAVTVGSRPVVQLLLRHGADARLRNAAGQDAVEYALAKKRDKIADMIRESAGEKKAK
jgi:ankyrin repeat protein